MWQLAGLFVFFVAGLAELQRPPFDMPVADAEIIFGPYTEYTGIRFAVFLLAEYAGIVALSAIASVLFLGGFQPLPFLSFIPGWMWMAGRSWGSRSSSSGCVRRTRACGRTSSSGSRG